MALLVSIRERIAELETEIVALRHMVTLERDTDIRNLAAKLIQLLIERIAVLKQQM